NTGRIAPTVNDPRHQLGRASPNVMDTDNLDMNRTITLRTDGHSDRHTGAIEREPHRIRPDTIRCRRGRQVGPHRPRNQRLTLRALAPPAQPLTGKTSIREPATLPLSNTHLQPARTKRRISRPPQPAIVK